MLTNTARPQWAFFAILYIATSVLPLARALSSPQPSPQSANRNSETPVFDNANDSIIYFSKKNLEETAGEQAVSDKTIIAVDEICLVYVYSGRGMMVVPYLKLIPDTLMRENPEILNRLGSISITKGMTDGLYGKYDSALFHYQLSISYYEKSGDLSHIPNIRNNMANAMMSMGDYQEAMQIFFSNLDIDTLDENSKVINRMNIGDCLINLGQYQEARPFIQTAADFFSREDSYSAAGVNISYVNIAKSYLLEQKYDSGLYYINYALEKAEKDDYEYGIFSAKSLKGQYYLMVKEWEKAREVAQEVYDYHTRKNLDRSKAKPLITLVEASFKSGNIQQAYSYIEEGLAISKDLLKSKQLELDYLQLLEEIQASEGKYKQAYTTQKSYADLKSKMIDAERTRQIAKMESAYKTKQIKQELALSRSEQEITKGQLTEQKLRESFLIYGIVAIMFILILGIIFYLILRKNKMVLARQNEQLKILNQTKDRFFAIVGHDLRGPITSFSGVQNLISSYIQRNEMNKLKELGSNISRKAHQLDNLLNNLLNWATSQSGVIPYHPESLQLFEVVREVGLLFDDMLDVKNITFINQVSEDLEVYADQNALMLVLRNLISNAVKFTSPGGKIRIVSQLTDHRAEIKVIDNGQGIESDKLEELLYFNRHHSVEGTANERGNGLGLVLCKEYAELNKGALRIESKKGEGSAFIFDLPINESTQSSRLAS